MLTYIILYGQYYKHYRKDIKNKNTVNLELN